ncbi:MAG: adenylyl-sulfate kinase [Phycisphaeraceae bacterium]
MTEPKATNITWHEGTVDRDARAKSLGQKGCTVWFTGLSGSGKSTVAVAVEQMLHAQGKHAYRLDGDNVRHGLCSNLGFSAEDRDENIRRIGEVAKLFADSGLITLCSFVSPYRDARDKVRKLHEDAGLAFFECFVDIPIEVAQQRDPKGLYAKAAAGEIKDMTGLSEKSPFEAPEKPEIRLPTHEQSVEKSAGDVIESLISANIISSQ